MAPKKPGKPPSEARSRRSQPTKSLRRALTRAQLAAGAEAHQLVVGLDDIDKVLTKRGKADPNLQAQTRRILAQNVRATTRDTPRATRSPDPSTVVQSRKRSTRSPSIPFDNGAETASEGAVSENIIVSREHVQHVRITPQPTAVLEKTNVSKEPVKHGRVTKQPTPAPRSTIRGQSVPGTSSAPPKATSPQRPGVTAPSTIPTACERFVQAMTGAEDYAQGLLYSFDINTFEFDDPVTIGQFMEDQAVYRAIAAVTEAITELDRGVAYALLDQDTLIHAMDEDSNRQPVYNRIVRPESELLLPWIADDHITLFAFENNGVGRWHMNHFDSLPTSTHTTRLNEPGGTASTVRNRLLSAQATQVAIHRPKGLRIQAHHQRNGWECGMHTIFTAWARALRLNLRNARIERYNEFIRRGAEVIRVAIRGLISANDIRDFLECFGYVLPHQRVFEERSFQNTVRLLRTVDLEERVRRAQYELLFREAQATGSINPDWDFSTQLASLLRGNRLLVAFPTWPDFFGRLYKTPSPTFPQQPTVSDVAPARVAGSEASPSGFGSIFGEDNSQHGSNGGYDGRAGNVSGSNHSDNGNEHDKANAGEAHQPYSGPRTPPNISAWPPEFGEPVSGVDRNYRSPDEDLPEGNRGSFVNAQRYGLRITRARPGLAQTLRNAASQLWGTAFAPRLVGGQQEGMSEAGPAGLVGASHGEGRGDAVLGAEALGPRDAIAPTLGSPIDLQGEEEYEVWRRRNRRARARGRDE